MLPFLEHINQMLWGFPVLALLACAHLYYTIRLKFPQKHTFRAILLSVTPEANQDENNLSGFAALATTLAATLGTETSSVSPQPLPSEARAPCSGVGSPGFWAWPPAMRNAI